MEPRRIPVFATEAEEAKWWYDNRDVLANDFVEARKAGRLGEGSKARWRRKQAERETEAPAPEAAASVGRRS